MRVFEPAQVGLKCCRHTQSGNAALRMVALNRLAVINPRRVALARFLVYHAVQIAHKSTGEIGRSRIICGDQTLLDIELSGFHCRVTNITGLQIIELLECIDQQLFVVDAFVSLQGVVHHHRAGLFRYADRTEFLHQALGRFELQIGSGIVPLQT